MLHKSIGFAAAAILLSLVLINVARRTTQKPEAARPVPHVVNPGVPSGAAPDVPASAPAPLPQTGPDAAR